jgi:HEAT repeat
VPDVRLNVITNLHHAHELLGVERLQASVLPAIEELTQDPHWRVRHAVIEKLPLLAEQLGPEFYEQKLLTRNCDWLHDPVATIRDAAMEALIDVGAVFGEAWAAEKSLPAMLTQLKDPFYLYRITCIQARLSHCSRYRAAHLLDQAGAVGGNSMTLHAVCVRNPRITLLTSASLVMDAQRPGRSVSESLQTAQASRRSQPAGGAQDDQGREPEHDGPVSAAAAAEDGRRRGAQRQVQLVQGAAGARKSVRH